MQHQEQVQRTNFPGRGGQWWSFVRGNQSMSQSHRPKDGGSSVTGAALAQKLEGRQDPEDSHWGCSQGTFGCEVDQHLQRNNCRRQSEMRSGIQHVTEDFFDYSLSFLVRFPVKQVWVGSVSVSLQGKCYALQSDVIHVKNLCMNPCPAGCVALSYSF